MTKDLFLKDPLEKCFYEKEIPFWTRQNPFREKKATETYKVESAQLLIDHILEKEYDESTSYFMRNIIVAASRKILQCDQEPYPFKNLKTFFEL